MDSNTRSYISRFSGLLLFLLTLLVVGILVILTIRAASTGNDDTSSNDDSSQVADADDGNRDFIIDGDDTVERDEANLNGVVVTPDEDLNTDVAGDSDASDDDTNVAGAFDDSNGDTPSTVAIAAGSELPNTGIGESVLGVILVLVAVGAFAQSRRDLASSLK